MKVIVAGSRTITDPHVVFDAINKSNFKITELVSGGARGVDRIAEDWARLNNVPIKVFTPHYSIDNPHVAPLLRNVDMADYSDALIAVWNGKSKGTAHVIKCMKDRNKSVEIVEYL